MAKQENVVSTGLVTQELGNSTFKVVLDNADMEVFCTISGKIRKNRIRIIVGDKVRLEMSPYDLTKGRIVTRLKDSTENQEPNNSDNKNKFNFKNKKK